MTVTYDTSRVTLVDHPLVQHKLSILRDKSTGTNQFRQLVDPMLATGGSAEMAISYLRERGVKDIRMLCIVAAPEGLKSLTEKDPDVHIYTCAIDDHLNEAAYIVPGLGDAGDRIYGTL